MPRQLTRGEMLLGTIGLAMLRLHRSGDTTASAAIRAELGALLARIDEPRFGEDALGEQLDLVAGYTRWATVYDQPGNPVIDHEQKVVWPLIDLLPGDPVLDAACGTGRHLQHLASAGRTVVGVDATAAMLDVARSKVSDADLREGDLLALPVDDDSMAGAVCALALEHVADLTGAYRELARVVRRSGWVITSTTHPEIRNILGWGAWFVDVAGLGEVATQPQQVSDHLNAAADAGLRLVRSFEPTIDHATARHLASSQAPVSTAAAVRGVPIVLVCQFENQ